MTQCTTGFINGTYITGICVPTQHPDDNNTHGVPNTQRRILIIIVVIQIVNDPTKTTPSKVVASTTRTWT